RRGWHPASREVDGEVPSCASSPHRSPVGRPPDASSCGAGHLHGRRAPVGSRSHRERDVSPPPLYAVREATGVGWTMGGGSQRSVLSLGNTLAQETVLPSAGYKQRDAPKRGPFD